MYNRNSKNRIHYGSFRAGADTSKFNVPQKTKTAKPKRWMAVLLFVVVAAGIAGYNFYQKKNKLPGIDIPEATASEIPGWWYRDYFGYSVCSEDACKPDADPDKDKLTNAQEFYYHSDPLNKDTNGNGKSDGEDVAHNVDPSRPGTMTFDQAASDDNIVGESLVFDDTIKQELSEALDINKVRLPEVRDAELNISGKSGAEVYTEYMKTLNSVINRNFPQDRTAYIESVTASNDPAKLADAKARSIKTVGELKALEVPKDMLRFHRLNIQFYMLLPNVLKSPTPEQLSDKSSVEANLWYDSTQAFMVVMQKMDLEVKAIQQNH